MKRYFEIIYWFAATGLISLLFMSLADNYFAALFLAVMMLPGALLAKFLGGTISFKNRFKGIMDTIYFLLIILVLEYLLIFYLVYFLFFNLDYNLSKPSTILFNPLFIWLLLLAFWGLERFLAAKLSVDEARSRFIEFTSERKKIRIEVDAISYIESRDDIVFVVVSDGDTTGPAGGKQYRTKMNITQWSNVLDDRFVRVHRSFIVNRRGICGMSAGRLKLDSGVEIDVSKRYRDVVEEWFTFGP
ncbi:MAG: LytTR family transcriptional regulator DNA-binding domain-containing protein [Bacteroidales bacterium]|nr:LytTR family transcriptional regulator DNA-binding domain-containing protein [Bacteroidales bacterium]